MSEQPYIYSVKYEEGKITVGYGYVNDAGYYHKISHESNNLAHSDLIHAVENFSLTSIENLFRIPTVILALDLTIRHKDLVEESYTAKITTEVTLYGAVKCELPKMSINHLKDSSSSRLLYQQYTRVLDEAYEYAIKGKSAQTKLNFDKAAS